MANLTPCEMLRTQGKFFERSKETVVLPGWDSSYEQARGRSRSIRHAAGSVVAYGTAFDDEIPVLVSSIGMLIQYIADMLEE